MVTGERGCSNHARRCRVLTWSRGWSCAQAKVGMIASCKPKWPNKCILNFVSHQNKLPTCYSVSSRNVFNPKLQMWESTIYVPLTGTSRILPLTILRRSMNCNDYAHIFCNARWPQTGLRCSRSIARRSGFHPTTEQLQNDAQSIDWP